MERTDSGFYVIDAYSLSKTSGKPFHLAQRFPNYPRLSDALYEAQLKRDALLDARRVKLTQRFQQVQMVAHSAKEKNELRRLTIEQNLLAAEKKRTARLEKLRLSNREMVERAKSRAREHRLTSMANQGIHFPRFHLVSRKIITHDQYCFTYAESRRRAIDQKLLKSEKRRMAMQRRTKSQLMKPRSALIREEQFNPLSKLPLPLYKRLQAAIKVFRKFGLQRPVNLEFQEFVRTLKDTELIAASAVILAHGKPKTDKKKARIFLTAFMIISSPTDILLDVEGAHEQVC